MEGSAVWVVRALMFDGRALSFGPFGTDEEAVEFAHTALNDPVTETDEYASAAALVGAPPVEEDALFVREYTIDRLYADVVDARRDLFARAADVQ